MTHNNNDTIIMIDLICVIDDINTREIVHEFIEYCEQHNDAYVICNDDSRIIITNNIEIIARAMNIDYDAIDVHDMPTRINKYNPNDTHHELYDIHNEMHMTIVANDVSTLRHYVREYITHNYDNVTHIIFDEIDTHAYDKFYKLITTITSNC